MNCLTHATANSGDADQVNLAGGSNPPFQFIGGTNNPVAGVSNKSVIVSDSLVTVPVFNSTNGVVPTNPVQIMGFVQLFLNPDGNEAPASGHVNTFVINIVSCGPNTTGQPIIGNGASPVAVRLIMPTP